MYCNRREISLYVIFGVCTTLINILAFNVISKPFGIHYLMSNFVAWIISVEFAFVTNKIFVFRSQSWKCKIWMRELITFVGARLLTCAMDMLFMYVSVSVLGFHKLLSKIIINILVIIVNYIISKACVFRKQNIV